MSDILPSALQTWINEQNGVCVRDETIERSGGGVDRLLWYSVSGRVFLVQIYPDGDGVEVFLPTPNTWPECLRAVASACGVPNLESERVTYRDLSKPSRVRVPIRKIETRASPDARKCADCGQDLDTYAWADDYLCLECSEDFDNSQG